MVGVKNNVIILRNGVRSQAIIGGYQIRLVERTWKGWLCYMYPFGMG